MAHKLIITSFAHNDEDEAYEWYEKQRTGFGDEILKNLKLLIKRLPTILNTTALLMKEKNSEIF